MFEIGDRVVVTSGYRLTEEGVVGKTGTVVVETSPTEITKQYVSVEMDELPSVFGDLWLFAADEIEPVAE